MPGASGNSAGEGSGGCGLEERAVALVSGLAESNPQLEAVLEVTGGVARVYVREECEGECGLEDWKVHLSLQASRLGLRIRSYRREDGWSVVELTCG
ncbi:hypothetical protein [Aeropyrum camini]|uniref:Site-specific recombinase n=1 Tax=Aeropyrum camini SY1 = JCM 12091 TaxID=1198449 RepID=U3TAB7_9CREN|nr:hypothetical protein [Aeropyrum camini]BAN90477.1 site-specific recombinase [Aeropyrum camini SY1 = JCM 12091]